MCHHHDKNSTGRRAFLKVATTGSIAVAAGALTAAGAAAQTVEPDQANEIIKDWPETATSAAKAMLEKYGPPNEATPSLLIWYNNGPWKRTIVYKEEIDHDFPMPHKDVMEQVINYEVPPDKFDELANYDGSVIVERTKGEISARCDKEGANILALNLAHDIITGDKNVDQARKAYGEAMMKMMEGNPPESVQKLGFEVKKSNTGDSDKAIIEKS